LTPTLSSSAACARCQIEPGAELPIFISPGLAREAVRNSSIVFQGASARTVIAAAS